MVHMSRLTPAQKFILAISLPITLIFLYLLFRRGDDEDEEEVKSTAVAGKRQVEKKIIVPQHAIGAVVGSHGSQIKQIQDLTKAQLSFQSSSKSGEDHILVVRGTEDAVEMTEAIILKVINDVPTVTTDVVTIPTGKLQQIIGRNGDVIRSLTRQSMAKIELDRSGCGEGKDATVTVKLEGTRAAIDTAKTLIRQKLGDETEFRAGEHVTIDDQDKTVSFTVGQPVNDTVGVSSTNNVPSSRADPDSPCGTSISPAVNTLSSTYSTVYVSAVEHPGHFWVQVIDREATRLDSLVSEMTTFYTTQGESVIDVRVGDVVAAPFDADQSWYRAEVSLVDDDQVDLYYPDFGDSGLVAKDRIRQLRPEFQSLPFQALECCMANIRPTDSDEWTNAATDLFEQLTHVAQWKPLMCRSVGVVSDRGGFEMPTVQLVDTSGSADVDVASELVRHSHAVLVNSSTQVNGCGMRQ